MNQATVVLVFVAVALSFYSFFVMRSGRKLSADALFVVGTRCAGGLGGLYTLLWALKLIGQSETETTRFYVGMIGLIFALWAFQRPYEMIKSVVTKKQARSKRK